MIVLIDMSIVTIIGARPQFTKVTVVLTTFPICYAGSSEIAGAMSEAIGNVGRAIQPCVACNESSLVVENLVPVVAR